MDETGEVEGLFAASETWTDSRLAWAKDRAIVAQFHALCDRLLAAQGEIHPQEDDLNAEYFDATWVRWLVDAAKRLKLGELSTEDDEAAFDSPVESPDEGIRKAPGTSVNGRQFSDLSA